MSLILDNIKTCSNLKDSLTGFDIYQNIMNDLKLQGRENSQEYVDAQQKYIAQKSKYINLGCSIDTESMDCIALNEQIESMISLIATETKLALYDKRKLADIERYKKTLAQYKLDYETKGCLLVLNKIAQAETTRTVDKFTALDEARIKEQNKYEVQQRIFFGGLILVAGFMIITVFNGKSK